MAIIGATDIGGGCLAVCVNHDPTADPTDVPMGSLIVYNGKRYIKADNGSTTNVGEVPLKNNMNATTDPTVDDDVDLGYDYGSFWLNKTTKKLFCCADPTDGAADWTVATNGSPSTAFPQFFLYADQLDTPNNADWAVNALAPAAADSLNNALVVRIFDDSAEEGVGFMLRVPTGATNIVFTFMSRAEAAGGGNVIPKVYRREVQDAGAPAAWNAGVALSALAFGANTNWNKDQESKTLASIGLAVGKLYQIELTRDAAAGGDTLVGDWDLLELVVEFT